MYRLDYFSCNHKQSPLEQWCRRLIDDIIKEYYGKLCINAEAEQALCYSNDIINCCKMYYVSVGKDGKYNVPIFTRIKDSLGNDHPRAQLEEYPWEEHFYTGRIDKVASAMIEPQE